MLSAAWFVLAGMGIVFGTLALLVLVMTVLARWLTPAPPQGASASRQRPSGGARSAGASDG